MERIIPREVCELHRGKVLCEKRKSERDDEVPVAAHEQPYLEG